MPDFNLINKIVAIIYITQGKIYIVVVFRELLSWNGTQYNLYIFNFHLVQLGGCFGLACAKVDIACMCVGVCE